MFSVKQLEKALRGKKVLIFLDLEGTQFSHEMVEIGAYKVILKDDFTVKKIFPGFKSYVKPHQRIGKVVTDLTGITEDMLAKQGVPYRVVQQGFKKYVGKDWDKCLFVTFGSHDFRIIMQSALNNLDASEAQSKYVVHHGWDYAEWIAQFIRDPHGNNYSLANYLRIFNVKFDGKAHDALVDAKNLIELYKAFLKHPEIVEAEYQKRLALHNTHYPEPMRKVLERLSEGETVTAEEYQQYIKDYLK